MKYFVAIFFLFPFSLIHAQTATSSASTITEKAQIVAVISQSMEEIAGTSVTSPATQSIKVKIVSGLSTGTETVIENDQFQSKAGDIIYVKHTVDPTDGVDQYSASDPYRLPALGFFIRAFVVCAILFGGRRVPRPHRARTELLAIAYILLPGILHGFSPIAVSMLVAALIVIVSSYIHAGTASRRRPSSA